MIANQSGETGPTAEGRVQTGASVLLQDVSILGHGRYGLVTNFTGVLPDLTRNVDGLRAAGLNLVALFGPEHGLRGSVQAGQTEHDEVDAHTGLPLFDTYLKTPAEIREMFDAAGLDAVIFDMQDIGTRFYTYVWTMFDCMLAAATSRLRFAVLDRPNPIGGEVCSGPGLDEHFSSFVGRADIPMRHGATAGELAVFFNQTIIPSRVGDALDLQVVRMRNWTRNMYFDETGLAWVPPSPNIPTLDSALAFAGMGLFEGTNLSEGRGTTRPFETIGAPYVDARLIGELRQLGLPGVIFRETWFVPTFHKYAGETLRGFQLHVTARSAFDPVATAVTVLRTVKRLYPDDFHFLEPNNQDRAGEATFAIDRLWGSDSLRLSIDDCRDPQSLLDAPKSPSDWCQPISLLYP